MNLEKNPTVEGLRELIKSCNDRAGHHVLWVAKNGDVRISRVPKDKSPVGFEDAQPDMQLRYETFEAGNDYVGPEAAKDDAWIGQLYDALVNEWPKAKIKPMVEYIDQF
jgi:hypothetical protein